MCPKQGFSKPILLSSFWRKGKKGLLNVRIEKDPGDHLLQPMHATNVETEATREEAPLRSQGWLSLPGSIPVLFPPHLTNAIIL